jgi:carbonic anhydrase/acetyltransferase-like protein (isoleucine patch superfamily)
MIRSYQGITPRIPASCYVDLSAQIIGDVVLGEQSSVWMNAVVRGDVHSIRIGNYSNIQDCSVLHGMRNRYQVVVGDYVTVGHNVTLHGCTIGNRCLIGMGAVILNNCSVGDGCIIAAGAVLPENTTVEPFTLWAGVPAAFRKKIVDDKTQEMILQYARNYLEYNETYLRETSKQ